MCVVCVVCVVCMVCMVCMVCGVVCMVCVYICLHADACRFANVYEQVSMEVERWAYLVPANLM